MQPITKYSEEELVTLLRTQDQSAFSYLYDNYAAALNGIITRMVDDTQLAEDILQEAFLKIWNNFKQYDTSKGRLFTWMINITRNLTIDTLRSKGYKKGKKISQDENSVITYQDKNFTSDRFDTIGLRKQLQYLKPEQKVITEIYTKLLEHMTVKGTSKDRSLLSSQLLTKTEKIMLARE